MSGARASVRDHGGRAMIPSQRVLNGLRGQTQRDRTAMQKLRAQPYHSWLYRDHGLIQWEVLDDHTEEGTCSICGLQVVLNVKPQTNEIEIGGEAIAKHCTGAL